MSADAVSAHDATQEDASGASVRLATVNLRCMLEDWPTRVELLATQIGAVDPDLLALQEVCRIPDEADALPQLLSRLAALTGRSYVFARTETHLSWELYQEGIAVVTPHEIGDQQVVHLPTGVFPRSMVVTRVQTPLGSMLFASTHLSFGDEQSAVRVAQLDAARSALAELRAADELVALAGDFNETPEGAAIGATLAAGYIDAWAALHPSTSGATFPSSAPTTRIDYVLISNDGSDTVPTVAEVFLDQAQGSVLPSDHLGVWAELARR